MTALSSPRTLLIGLAVRLAARLASLGVLAAVVVAAGACEPGGGESDETGASSESDSVTEESGVEDETDDLSDLPARALKVHNDARAAARPAPTPALRPLAWDDDLAEVAQAYADRCKYGHSMGEYGENLFAQAGKQVTPEEAMGAWAAEIKDYDHATGTCAAGAKCGHYTQMVWRDTTRVGCGVADCTTGSPFGSDFPTWQYWVCNYDPIGNWQGEKPY